jgi:alginate O-acetyltransferase complex protein AlgI
MIFNSFAFLLFLPVVSLICIMLKREKSRIAWMLFSSYFFYMYWEPKYIIIILFSTIIDYFISNKIHLHKDQKTRKFFLILSIFFNLGILFTFKYFNFLSEFTFNYVPWVSLNDKPILIDLLLPVGISFYTFQTMSYTIDIYKRKQKPEKNFLTFALFVSYFPQLVAGPIERSKNLLPQIANGLKFKCENLSFFFRMFLWGMFKKIVIADNVAPYVNLIFGTHYKQSSLSLFIGSVLFSIQIYCDFSGYSDIAIGTSKLFNIKLMDNFKTPYLAKSMSEHWQRWHISLSTWFRDYVYIPLGGSNGSKLKTFRNVMITFVVSGIWHGANWTFVFWGAIHGFFVGLEKLINFKFKVPKFMKIIFVFNVANIAFILFRAEDLTHAFDYIYKMLSLDGIMIYKAFELVKITPFIVILFFVDIFLGEDSFGSKLDKLNPNLRIVVYILISHIILQNGAFHGTSFIYFQF